eukprot:768466-Hanusia_phi.AAC.4
MYERVEEAPPAQSWGSDPLWNTMVPVTASMIHGAYSSMINRHGVVSAADAELPARRGHDGVGIMVVGRDRVVSRVRLLGDVVSVKDRDTFVEFKLDDSTELITCILWKSDAMKPGLGYDGVKLGSHLHVGGKLSQYRGEVCTACDGCPAGCMVNPDTAGPALCLVRLYRAQCRCRDILLAEGKSKLLIDSGLMIASKMVDLHVNHYSKANAHCLDTSDHAVYPEYPSTVAKRSRLQRSEKEKYDAPSGEMEVFSTVEPPIIKLDEAIRKFASNYSCENCIFSFEAVLQDEEVVQAAKLAILQVNPPNASPDFESFRVRASVTHSIARLRKKGWIALCDQEQDLYTYVGTTKDVSKSLLQFLKVLEPFFSCNLSWSRNLPPSTRRCPYLCTRSSKACKTIHRCGEAK